MKKSLLALVAGVMVLGSGVADAKTLKFQISSKSGDWAHNYLTENWKQLEVVTEGSLKMDVLPTKAVVPHRETIDAVANRILDGDMNDMELSLSGIDKSILPNSFHIF